MTGCPERGEGWFGFFHPTFKEYLAARACVLEGQIKGVAGTWEVLRPHLDDALWHEVILLTVGYKAIIEAQKAVELNPNCHLAYGSLGTVLSIIGEPDESIRNNEIALRSNPKDPSIFFRYSGIAMAHFRAGRYSEASQWARKSINRKPNWRMGHAVLVSSLVQLNLFEEAEGAVDIYLENIPNETISGLRKVLHFGKSEDKHRFEEGLHKAGLPE